MCLRATHHTIKTHHPHIVYAVREKCFDGTISSPTVHFIWERGELESEAPILFVPGQKIIAEAFHVFESPYNALKLASYWGDLVYECIIPPGSMLTVGVAEAVSNDIDGEIAIVSSRLILGRKASQRRYGKHYLRRDVVALDWPQDEMRISTKVGNMV